MAPQHEEATPGYWRIPGTEFPDGEEPMLRKLNIKSLLLQPRFCWAGKDASRRDRFESNLRAIFRALIYFEDCIPLGEDFWSKFSNALCQYWDGSLLREAVLLYAGARKRYIDKHPRGGAPDHQTSDVVADLIDAIDVYLSQTSLTAPKRSVTDLKRAFDKKKKIWNASMYKHYMWPPRGTKETNLSIKGIAARVDSQPSYRHVDQHHPIEPPRGPASMMRRVSERSEDSNNNEGPSLASRISAPSKSGPGSAVPSDQKPQSLNNNNSSNIPESQSPRNTLKRGASFSLDSGPSKRRTSDADWGTQSTMNQQVRAETKPKDPAPVHPSSHVPDHTNGVDTVIFNTNPEIPKTQAGHESPKSAETGKKPETETEREIVKEAETVKQPEMERINQIQAQLNAIGELLNTRFSGIETQVVAVQEQVSRNAALHHMNNAAVQLQQAGGPSSPTAAGTGKLPLGHYVDEYLRDRDHNVLLRGVSEEIHKLKRYLIYGLRDHEHNQTGDAWKSMEPVWAALDEAERRAGSS